MRLYPSNSADKLEFNLVKEAIFNRCKGDSSRLLAEDIGPMYSPEEASERMALVLETGRLLALGGQAFFEDLPFLEPLLQQLAIDGFILAEFEIFQIGRVAKNLGKLQQYILRQTEELPTLKAFIQSYQFDLNLLKDLDACLDKEGNLRPDASTALSKAYKAHRHCEEDTRRKLLSIFKNAREKGYNAETGITVRGGRLVIPILAEHKRRIPGIIHDESATGKTVYLEPNDVFELNNELKNIEYEIQREKRKVLAHLCEGLRSHLYAFREAYRLLSEADLLRATAEYVGDFDGIQPAFRKAGTKLSYAFHPLLLLKNNQRSKPTIPLSMELTEDTRVILVSGPNAGGKSIALKTLGLLQFMAQSGIPVPVGAKSEFGWFDQLLVDLGDNQSVENELSTYSSHLNTMKHFVENSDGKSLFLIDEFGTGTDPTFGGAIAESILDFILTTGAYGMVNTHFSNLKIYAQNHPGISNASMGFDHKSFEPMYTFEQGKPGSSYALEIARKIGLQETIIRNAERKAGEKNKDVDGLLIDLQRREVYLNDLIQKNSMKDDLLEELIQKQKNQEAVQDRMRKEIIRKANEEAAAIIQSANARIEATVQEILQAGGDKEKIKETRKELQAELLKVAQKAERKEPKPQKTVAAEKALKPGDPVEIIATGARAVLVELKKNKAIIESDSVRMTLSADSIKAVTGGNKQPQKQKVTVSIVTPVEGLTHRLDVRGMRGPEAMAEVERWIDRAVLSGAGMLSILHGKGDGILRKLLREILRKHPNVKDFNSAHIEQGGDGITEVTLK